MNEDNANSRWLEWVGKLVVLFSATNVISLLLSSLLEFFTGL